MGGRTALGISLIWIHSEFVGEDTHRGVVLLHLESYRSGDVVGDLASLVFMKTLRRPKSVEIFELT